MRKMRGFCSLFIWIFILGLASEVWAGQASKTYTFSAGDTIIADEFNTNFDNVYNAYNAHDTAVTAIHGMGTAVLMGTTLTQTSSNKTEISPTITTAPTAAGATWSDLGTVTSSTHTWIKVNSGTFVSPTITTSPTAAGATWSDLGTVTSSTHTWIDINGGTVDGATIDSTTIGATTPSTAVVTTLDTGQGANELYAMNQDVETTDAVVFATLDTGQGANELYDMNQNVQTTDSVTFSSMTITAVTRYYSLGATDFVVEDTGNFLTFGNHAEDVKGNLLGTPNPIEFAPVHLPHEATLTQIDYYIYGSADGWIEGELFKVNRTGTATQIGTSAQSATTATYQTLTDDFTDEAVDNSGYSYFVGFNKTIATKVTGIRISYTTTSSLP